MWHIVIGDDYVRSRFERELCGMYSVVKGEHFKTSATQSLGYHEGEGLVIINNENTYQRCQ